MGYSQLLARIAEGDRPPDRKRCNHIVASLQFRRHDLPLGGESIPVLVGSENDEPKAVFMSYEAFLDLAATLYTAVELLKEADIDPDLIEAVAAEVPALRRVV